jgi:hypothetical protein
MGHSEFEPPIGERRTVAEQDPFDSFYFYRQMLIV